MTVFFSNVVLISLTNESRGITAVWNLLRFTFPLFWSIIFSFLKAIVSLWKSLQRFVAMFQFFGILIEVKYLQDSLPFPTLPLNFWRFGGTGRFDRVSRYILDFTWFHVFEYVAKKDKILDTLCYLPRLGGMKKMN